MNATPPSEEAEPHSASMPYKTTAVFDQDTLPAALRREHSTKAGVWGIIRLLEGELILRFMDGSPPERLTPDRPGLVQPEQKHLVEVIGPMRMQVEFHDRRPGTLARVE